MNDLDHWDEGPDKTIYETSDPTPLSSVENMTPYRHVVLDSCHPLWLGHTEKTCLECQIFHENKSGGEN